MAEPVRLDRLLVAEGLARSRAQAQELIRAGNVLVSGRVVDKPAYAVEPETRVTVDRLAEGWVGRGAGKLSHALQEWAPEGLAVSGRRCLDVGASTGGFTQVLLREGAAHVTALDVGHGQLVPELAADPRVRDLPGTNIRHASPTEVGGPFDLVVADLSFISLQLVLPALTALAAPEGDLVLLVKPQFEVGRERLGKGGLVRSPGDRARALHQVVGASATHGLLARGLTRSSVSGTHGNTEYLLWLSPGAPGMMSIPDATARIDQLTGEEHR